MRRNMEGKLESHEYGKLRGKQVPPVQPEHGLRPLDQRLQLLALHVIQLGGEDQTCPRAELPILFVDHLAKDQLLKVDIRLKVKMSERVVRREEQAELHFEILGSEVYHGNRHIINIATKSDLAHLQLDAPQLAQGQLDPRKPLHELLIELLLQVARLHIFYDTCDVGGERQESTMFASSQPTIKGVRVVRLGKRLGEERLVLEEKLFSMNFKPT